METKRFILTAIFFTLLTSIVLNGNTVFGDTNKGKLSKKRTPKTFVCEQRGGKELPDKVLRMQKCILEGPLFLLDPAKFDSVTKIINMSEKAVDTFYIKNASDTIKLQTRIVLGRNCQCVTPPENYNGEMGCNLTWETFCIR